MKRIAIMAGLGLALGLTAAQAASQAPALSVDAVSAPARFVTGEKVLVRVTGGEGAAPAVTLNGKPAAVEVASFAPGARDALVEGLTLGENRIAVKSGAATANLVVVAHDPKKPVISGPH